MNGSRRIFWIVLVLVLILDVSLALADDDWSFRRSRRYGGSGGHSGPLGGPDLALGAALAFGAAGLALAAVYLVQAWLFSSLLAAKILTVLAVFSPLAWPLFLLGLLPPVAVYTLMTDFLFVTYSRDPCGSILLCVFLFLTSVLYFYLLFMLLGLFSKRPWGKYCGRLFMFLTVAGGIIGLIAGRGAIPFLLFAACLVAAAAAWRLHGKITARIAAKRNAAANG